jgi:hypothetical protein
MKSSSVFTHIILTAPSQNIADVYQIQLQSLKASLHSLQHCQIFCVSDPEGCRIGSGGGTVNAVDFLVSQIGANGVAQSQILIIHSGGDSRRAPLYSLCGKAWTTINSTVDASAVANPVLLLIDELSTFCRNLTPGSMVVASSDVMLHIAMNREGPQLFPDNAVSVVCVPELPSVAKNHGVFVGSNINAPPSDLLTGLEAAPSSNDCGETYQTNIAANYLQKPSVADMRAKSAICLRSSAVLSDRSNQEDDNEFALIDTGRYCFPHYNFQHSFHNHRRGNLYRLCADRSSRFAGKRRHLPLHQSRPDRPSPSRRPYRPPIRCAALRAIFRHPLGSAVQ